MMTAEEFVSKAVKIASACRTLYVLGGWGQVATSANKTKAINQYAYNKQNANKIRNAQSDTFFFDCVCLIKSILWGFDFKQNMTCGGAVYASNSVPDVGEGTMISMCKDVTSDFSNILPGEAVWMPGHIGIYISNGLAVESTPAWNDCVQFTAVGNIGKKSGIYTRTWTKHGKLPWVDYQIAPGASPAAQPVKDALSDYTDEQLAVLVISGRFGNGAQRKAALGSRYKSVQNLVDLMCRQKTAETFKAGQKIHIVSKGENLTIIARQYGTTVDRIVNDNQIFNKNLIHVGQRLIING